MTFARPPAGDDPQWPRASAWLAGDLRDEEAPVLGEPLRVVGAPCSVGSISPSEAWRTPPAVRQALARLSAWDPVTGRDLAGMDVADLGDWDVAELELARAVEVMLHHAGSLDPAAAVHVFLGGDNAVTRPCAAGLLGPDLGRVGLVTLDAHHDVRHLDDGPRNGTPVRGLIEDGLDPTHVVQIGIGRFTNSAAYAAWCDAQGIRWVTAPEVHDRGIDAVVGDALDHLEGCDAIYVDLDVDVLDVAHAPACPGARPGGLTPDQLYRAATLLGSEPRVRGADLVEVDAASDHDGRTVMATAQTLLAFAAGVASR
jgi:formiminoglutamase